MVQFRVPPSSTDAPILLDGGAHVLVHPTGPGALAGHLLVAGVGLEETTDEGAVGQLDEGLVHPGPGAHHAAHVARGPGPACQTSFPRTLTT